MIPHWKPANAEQVAEAVSALMAANTPCEILGTGTRRGFGAPVKVAGTLDLSALNGVVDYQPEELVLTLQPGTPVAEVQALLRTRRQMLAFEPPDFGPLWGLPAGGGTIGGCMMVGRGGARRLTAGGPRDHCLGVRGVNGFGEAFAAGGRVVKNVTGFDLSKLLVGSFGTLCVLTQLTLKVLPAAADSATIVLAGLSDAEGVRALSAALGSTAQLTSAAHLPANVAVDSTVPEIARLGAAATLLRLEGSAPSVAARRHALVAQFQATNQLAVLGPEESQRAWREVTDASFFAADQATVLWKLSLLPSEGAALGSRLAAELDGRCCYDWGGGGVWLELPAAADAHEASVRGGLQALRGGHATLIRAPEAVRAAVAPLQPLSPVELRVTRAVKERFDPQHLFNPGRMHRDA